MSATTFPGTPTKAEKPKTPYHTVVADKLIKQIQEGTAPWQKPWQPGQALPYNPISGTRYRGINMLNLMTSAYEDQRWMTYKQASEKGYQVKRGEKSTVVEYWQYTAQIPVTDEDGNTVLDANGKEKKQTVRLERPRVFYANVFNAEQMEGVPPEEKLEMKWDPIKRAEDLLRDSGAIIEHDANDQAYYNPAKDEIHLPRREQFPDEQKYYATAMHELGHWTGHESRLDRESCRGFGRATYAREELRAEIASMLVCNELGIENNINQNAAYVESWVQLLTDHPEEIRKAARDADQAFNYVMDLEHNLEQEQNHQLEQSQDAEQARTAGMETEHHQTSQREAARVDFTLPEKEVAREFEDTALKNEAETQPDRNTGDRRPPAPSRQRIERIKLAVPYGEKELAKAAGAVWNKTEKTWETGPRADMDRLKRWLPSKEQENAEPAIKQTPREEFRQLLENLGAVVEEPHPIFDKQSHRIQAVGDRAGEVSVFYKVHPDGRPAGYAKNHRSGVEIKWAARGHVLDTQAREQIKAQAAKVLEERSRELRALHEKTSQKLTIQAGNMKPPETPTPYLESKGIGIHAGVLKAGKTTCIPLYDTQGKINSMQYIQEDGQKRLAADSHKLGSFHAVGGLEGLKAAPAIVISEGYATAASISEAVNHPTVAAIDTSNLKPVAEALRKEYPDKPIVIAGDDDRHLEGTVHGNTGRKHAQEAANAVNGLAVFPKFLAGERESTEDRLTDFNDLATKSKQGKEGVKTQIEAAINRAKHMAAERSESRGIESERRETPEKKGINR